MKNGCDKSRDTDNTLVIMKNGCLWEVDIGFKILMRKVKSPLKQTTPLQIWCLVHLLKGSLAKLDEHEAGRLRKVNVQVERKSGEIVDATAYQAYEEYVKEGLKARQIYLNEILEGEDLISKEYADYFRNFLCDKTEK